MKQPRIIAVHLLNDFSGSPFVLRQALEELRNHQPVEVFTATPSGRGFLSGLEGVTLHRLWYRRFSHRWLTLGAYLLSQFLLFFRLLFYLRKQDQLYVNTLLPFGASLAGRLRGIRVVMHVHEVSVTPALLRRFLLAVMRRTASQVLFVSEDLRRRTAYRGPCQVVYNSLPPSFLQQALAEGHRAPAGPFTLLMIASPRAYKGIYELQELAASLPDFRFLLVLNATAEEVEKVLPAAERPLNLVCYPAQADVHPFYRAAHLVLNLSRPDEWVETFGMTILEAMYYRKPVIVPPVGGITELVEDGQQGFRTVARPLTQLREQVQLLAACPDLYNRLSVSAFRKAHQFTPALFSKGIRMAFRAGTRPLTEQKSTAWQLSIF